MSIRQITEFASLIASHNRLIIESPQAVDDAQLHVCWHAARSRLIDELRRIDACASAGHMHAETSGKRAPAWGCLAPLLEEVFATEMLTRVWSALLTAREGRHAANGCGEVARNILILQLKVRQRALKLLVDGIAGNRGDNEIAAVDRTRRKLERWTDLLLGELVLREDVGDFACDARRAREFGVDYFQNQTHATYQCTWNLLIAGIRASFAVHGGATGNTANAPEDLFRAIMGCLPVDAFHDDGPPRALRTIRSRRHAIATDCPPSAAMLRLLPQAVVTRKEGISAPADGINFSKLRGKQK